MGNWKVHAEVRGPIVLVGFGAVGRGLLPLVERHISFDPSQLVVIDPSDANRGLLDERGIAFLKEELTPENYERILTPLLKGSGGPGFCINLSVDVSSVSLIRLCREVGAFYIDTVIEPWPGYYFDEKVASAGRTNYRLREALLNEKRGYPGGITAVTCCGANPGMVSWFVKRALMDLAELYETGVSKPKTRQGWAESMRKLGVRGVHIAERDTQCPKQRRPVGAFWNTWSADGFVAEGLQPAELGWGTHERWMPPNARRHEEGCGAAIYLEQAGVRTPVRTWCPTHGGQIGFLVTHNESISIADYFTVREGEEILYRPTCHYAYHPCDDALLSLHEMCGGGNILQPVCHVLGEDELVSGKDELGVLLYGHDKGAYWYGSQLTIEQARALAPYQNATTLQVTSAVLAGMVWAIENPKSGIVETEEMDYERCLEIQSPYLGPLNGYYTDWTPLKERLNLFQEKIDPSDPWQFCNVLVSH